MKDLLREAIRQLVDQISPGFVGNQFRQPFNYHVVIIALENLVDGI